MSLPTYMRAWTITSAAPPAQSLSLVDEPVPSLATETSLLIKVSHVALHPGTSLLLHIIPYFLRKPPFIAETDFAGTVVAAGIAVIGLHVGDQVFGSIAVAAHMKGAGALADYIVIDASDVSTVPSKTSLEQASCLSVSAITALDVVDLADLQPGCRVLINAPLGGVGSFAVQIIRHKIGPNGHITGICSSSSAHKAKEMGCDATIDYSSTTLHLSVLEQNGPFDTIIDCHGSQALWHASSDSLKPGPGHHYATVGPRFPSMSYLGMVVIVWQMIRNIWTPVWAGGVPRSYRQAASFITQEKLDRVKRLAEEGIVRPLVGSVWRMEDALEAYEVLMSGHAKGKVVVKVS